MPGELVIDPLRGFRINDTAKIMNFSEYAAQP